MNIFFRTDASYNIGTGHVMRCLTLADALNERGAIVRFICRNHPGFDISMIKDRGFELILLEYTEQGAVNIEHEDLYIRWLAYPWETDRDQTISAIAQAESGADWLIVDHYGLDSQWHSAMRIASDKIMVIDDLANRQLDCDILLDQNCHIDLDRRYESLIPEHTTRLLGPHYAMLRPEFKAVRENAESSRINNHLFVFFGGADPTDETTKTIEALDKLKNNVTADIVVGSANRNREKIEKLCSQKENLKFHINVSKMAELMSRASLAIGAGGTTTYERACLGLPTIFIAVADNQTAVSKGADILGIGKYLGESSAVTASELASTIDYLLNDRAQLDVISEKALATVDGAGTARVADKLMIEIEETARQ